MSTSSRTGFYVLEDRREALLFNAHTGAYFRLTARTVFNNGLPLRRAAVAATRLLREGGLRPEARALVPPHHALAPCGTVANSVSALRFEAASTHVAGSTFIFCGGTGTGKSTLVKLFEEYGATGSIDDPNWIAHERPVAPSVMWMLQPKRQMDEGIVQIRLKTIPTAMRILTHVHAPATVEARAEAFDLATRLAHLPVYEVYLPATVESLGRAIHDVMATQPS